MNPQPCKPHDIVKRVDFVATTWNLEWRQQYGAGTSNGRAMGPLQCTALAWLFKG